MQNKTPPHIIHAIQTWTALQPRGTTLLPAEASDSIRATMSEAARKGLGRTVISDLLIEHAGWQRSGRLMYLPTVPKLEIELEPISEQVT